MKSLIIGGILTASLALTANAAMAAASHVQKTTRSAPVTHHVTHPKVAARAPRRSYAYGPVGVPFNVGQFIQSMLGGPLPPPYAQIVQNAMKESASRRSGGGGGSYDWSASPTYDTSSPADTTGQDTAAAAMAEDQTIQEMNDTNAQTASMAAAEEENDEANAATLQTEINAGM
jgi:hypothetical protein